MRQLEATMSWLAAGKINCDWRSLMNNLTEGKHVSRGEKRKTMLIYHSVTQRMMSRRG